MKKTNQKSVNENHQHNLYSAEISNFTLQGARGFASYDENQETFTCRALRSGSPKIDIKNEDGFSADPVIDVVVEEMDKNELGGEPLNVVNGGTGKNFLSKNSILLGDGKDSIKELSKGEEGQVLISTENGFGFAKIEGKGLKITTEPTKLSLNTKPITIKATGGIKVDPIDSEIYLGDTINLRTSPFTLSTQGGLSISGKKREDGESTWQNSQEVHIGEAFVLKADPIRLDLKQGLSSKNSEVELGKILELVADPITFKTDTSMSISGGKETNTGESQFNLGEIISLETKPILLKTKKGLFISDGNSEVQEKKVKLAEEVILGTKPITLNTKGGLYIGRIEDKLQKKEVNLANEITLTADKINIQTHGGLIGGGPVALGETISLSSKESLKWVLIAKDMKMESNTGYIVKIAKDTTVNLELPSSPHIGDTIKIVGNGAVQMINKLGFWKINLRENEKIYFVKTVAQAKIENNKSIPGSLAGKHASDCVTILCIKEDQNQLEWIVTDNIGNLITNEE